MARPGISKGKGKGGKTPRAFRGATASREVPSSQSRRRSTTFYRRSLSYQSFYIFFFFREAGGFGRRGTVKARRAAAGPRGRGPVACPAARMGGRRPEKGCLQKKRAHAIV